MTSKMMVGIEKILFEIKPKAVVVFGDTNSTLAATLAAAKYYFPIIHIEAGVRCGNRYMPEEINRKIIDHTSDFLVTPSKQAVDNLKKEGISDGVLNLGDFMYDTFLFAKSIVIKNESIMQKYGIKNKKYILSTIHREGSTQNDEQLLSILNTLGSLGEPVILPMHPRTRSRIVANGYQSPEDSQLIIIEPIGYIEMLDLLLNARYVVTDSGGLQKEAYWAGVPCVTVMAETTWKETVDEGWNTLVGLDMEKLKKSVLKPKPVTMQSEIYGLPGSANRLVEVMNWI
jgi:UDP-N-acetylglucosamine 2-epimerase